ncbi:MAG: hypothetical protein WC279_13400, partial [Sulfurimonas sp.]|uniref:hypothetical protein n=1 Tax=Sulfurimonas sp. TaxID=2022749 RepID=UPI003569C5AE
GSTEAILPDGKYIGEGLTVSPLFGSALSSFSTTNTFSVNMGVNSLTNKRGYIESYIGLSRLNVIECTDSSVFMEYNGPGNQLARITLSAASIKLEYTDAGGRYSLIGIDSLGPYMKNAEGLNGTTLYLAESAPTSNPDIALIKFAVGEQKLYKLATLAVNNENYLAFKLIED